MSAASLQADGFHPPPPFSVVAHAAAEGVARVAPLGELDLAGAPALDRALIEAQDGAALVVLDLRGLTFCETAGLHVMLRADERAREQGGRFVVVPGPPAVQLVFERTGTDARLQFVGEPASPAGQDGRERPRHDDVSRS